MDQLGQQGLLVFRALLELKVFRERQVILG
jgi:hypothetical protein